MNSIHKKKKKTKNQDQKGKCNKKTVKTINGFSDKIFGVTFDIHIYLWLNLEEKKNFKKLINYTKICLIYVKLL